MKKCLLLVAAAICFLPLFSIAQTIEWQNTIGGIGEEELRSVKNTNDGGFILVGNSNSDISGDKNENSLGMHDYWVVKVNSSGNIQWQNTIGGGSDDVILSVDVTADGGYVLGGNSGSNISIDKTENCIGGFDYWIVKLDSLGNILWQNTIGGSSTDYLSTVKSATDGGFIIGGRSESPVSGDKSENNIGLIDIWIVKADSLGIVQWENTIGGNGNDFISDISVTDDGGFLLGCYSSSSVSGDKTHAGYGSYDYWVVKLDSLGNILWQNTIGGSDQDQLNTVHPTLDGGFILGGSSRSDISGVKTESNYGMTDYWILKIDSIGDIQFQNDIGGSDYDLLLQVEQSVDEGFLLSGYSSSSISGDKSENKVGIMDYWVVNTDSTGNITWQNTISAQGQNWLFSTTPSLNNGFLLGGYSDANISADKSENSNGGFDFWIVKISNQFNLVTGKVFIDLNSNNIQDLNENPVKYHKITDSTLSQFAFSNSSGSYSLAVIDTGTTFFSPTQINYYLSNPLNHSANFNSFYLSDSLNDFSFQPTGSINDVCIDIGAIGPFRPGFNATYVIQYHNLGTTSQNPIIVFFPDSSINYVSASQTPASVTSDSIIFSVATLNPYESGQIIITVEVDAGVLIGDTVLSHSVILPVIGDINPSCNVDSSFVLISGSMDPNIITVNRESLFNYEVASGIWLEYIIQFQNTGTDTAFRVKVLNTLDTNMLQLASLDIISSSHPSNIVWMPWEQNMHVTFNNILLPDSNVNEPASHGFIRYRIKPKSTLVSGDSITNYAAIYFDFNAPVITNTAVTHIVLPTSLNEITTSSDHLLLYPNPANSTLTIETDLMPSSESRLIISDVAGRTLFSKAITATSTKHNLDISSLSRGIYFVQVRGGERISRGRFVKE